MQLLRPREAKRDADEALRRNPDSARAYRLRANASWALDDAPEWCSECHPRGCKNLIAPDVLAKGRTTPVREVHDQFCAAFERPEAVGVEKKAAGPHEARAETTTARILDDDADAPRRRSPPENAPGRPPADDAIEAAGW